MHLATVQSSHKGCQQLTPHREESAKMFNVLGFREKSLWFCTEKTVQVPGSSCTSLGWQCLHL